MNWNGFAFCWRQKEAAGWNQHQSGFRCNQPEQLVEFHAAMAMMELAAGVTGDSLKAATTRKLLLQRGRGRTQNLLQTRDFTPTDGRQGSGLQPLKGGAFKVTSPGWTDICFYWKPKQR